MQDWMMPKHVFSNLPHPKAPKSSNNQAPYQQKPIKLIRKNLKIHIFPITKFALAQTKFGKFYPNLKTIHFI
jgi:hypothetical protein